MSSYVASMRWRVGNEARLRRTYMVIPNAHTSLSFDSLTLPCPFHSSGDQNSDAPFVLVVTWPSDRPMSATICKHPKSLIIALRAGAMRMLSLMRVRTSGEEGKSPRTSTAFPWNVSHLDHADTLGLQQHPVSNFVSLGASPQDNRWDVPEWPRIGDPALDCFARTSKRCHGTSVPKSAGEAYFPADGVA